MYFLFLCCLSLVVIADSSETPEVAFSDGKLEGSIMKTKTGRDFFAFQGIPYAEPPVGELRFKSPVPVKPWKGVVDARKSSAACPQQNFIKPGELDGNENCLHLNVFSPKLPPVDAKLLPVVVYIHGGAFICGSSQTEFLHPGFLLEKDLVLVTANYRLGALGFLSTGDEASPGNYGLKDQSLVLKWVNKNIKYFGGDPDSVTISGTSAGGASSHYHFLSPLSKGLFKGVMSQSGTSLCPWAIDNGENIKNSEKLAEKLGCPTTSTTELVDCLRNVEPEALLKAGEIFVEWSVGLSIPFKPTVEPQSPEAFLTDTPENLFKSGNFNDVPWMTGITKDEGLIIAAAFLRKPELFDELNGDFSNKMAYSLLYKYSFDNPDILMEKIRQFYFGNEKKLTLENAFSGLVNVYGDVYFGKCLDEAVRIYLKASKNPVYNYLFAHQSGVSFSELLSGPGKLHGVSHGDDLLSLFASGDMLFPHRNETEEDRQMTEIMTTLWEDFAKTGNPTPEADNEIRKKWEPVKSEKLEYYYIDSKIQEMRHPMFQERFAFWRSLSLQPKITNKEEL